MMLSDTLCEKALPYFPSNDNPFHPSSNLLSQFTERDPSHPQTKRLLSTSSTSSTSTSSDLEAQFNYRFQKTSWRQRTVAYLVLVLAIFVWLMLIVGVLVMTDNLVPGALQSYNKIKDMGIELANSKFEIDGLKAQVASLWGFVNQMSRGQKGGEEGQGAE